MHRTPYLLALPSALGRSGPGTDNGAVDFYEAMKARFSSDGIDFVDGGMADLPKSAEDVGDPKRKYWKEMSAGIETLYNKIVQDVDLKKHFPIFLGGDHSWTIGTFRGISKVFDSDLGMVYFDAHGDANSPEISPSGNVHGMTLYLLINEYEVLKEKNTFLVGTRNLDPLEQKYIEESEISIAEDHHDIHLQNYFLSFDLDVVDPSDMPGTATPESNGVPYEKMKEIFSSLPVEGLIGCDFMEYNPEYDKDRISLNRLVDLVSILISRVHDESKNS